MCPDCRCWLYTCALHYTYLLHNAIWLYPFWWYTREEIYNEALGSETLLLLCVCRRVKIHESCERIARGLCARSKCVCIFELSLSMCRFLVQCMCKRQKGPAQNVWATGAIYLKKEHARLWKIPTLVCICMERATTTARVDASQQSLLLYTVAIAAYHFYDFFLSIWVAHTRGSNFAYSFAFYRFCHCVASFILYKIGRKKCFFVIL